jgi:hypothetical protein
VSEQCQEGVVAILLFNFEEQLLDHPRLVRFIDRHGNGIALNGATNFLDLIRVGC